MRSSLRFYLTLIIGLVIFVVILIFIGIPNSFSNCIHEHKRDIQYHAILDSSDFFRTTFARVQLHRSCFRVMAGENDGMITALATILVSLFTLKLWKSTNDLWLAGERQINVAALAANAAKQSAETADRALRELERPWLFVELRPGIDGTSYLYGYGSGAVIFNIANYGRFPGTIQTCNASLTQIGFEPQGGILRDEFHGVIGPGKSMEGCSIEFPFDSKTHDVTNLDHEPTVIPVNSADFDTFFNIKLSYRGVSNSSYECGFCWRWDHGVGRWVEYNNSRFSFQA